MGKIANFLSKSVVFIQLDVVRPRLRLAQRCYTTSRLHYSFQYHPLELVLFYNQLQPKILNLTHLYNISREPRNHHVQADEGYRVPIW